jgi:hypothetical protein
MGAKFYNDEGWRDNVAQFSAAQGNGTTEPNWEDMGNGLYAYRFTNNEELFVNFHINHDVDPDGFMYPHIHFAPESQINSGETLTWALTYQIARGHQQGDLLGQGSTTTLNLVFTADRNYPAGEHIILECSDAQKIANPEPDTIMVIECKYQTGTYTDPVYGFTCDLHYQVDRNSTPNKSPNFYE